MTAQAQNQLRLGYLHLSMSSLSIHTTDSAFLQSNAKALILPMSTDGVILNRVTERTCLMYPCNYSAYQAMCKNGALALGDVFMHTVQHQATGLGVGSNKSANHIFNLVISHHAKHNAQKSTVISALKNLKPKLFELMRYHGLRHAALYATPLLSEDISPVWLLQTLNQLHVPRLRLDVHLSKTDLDKLSSVPSITPIQ